MGKEATQRVRRRERNEPIERAVVDYIAGMTDRYALIEHTRLFGTTPELR